MIRSFTSILKSSPLFLKQFYNLSIIKFNLPDLGQKIKQGTIKKLYVKQGDSVEEFQKLADVASDKQFTQITAGDSGKIKKIHYKQEDVCQVGELFLQIEVESNNEQVYTLQKEQSKTVQPNVEIHQNIQKKTNNQFLATPYVRQLMKNHNLKSEEIEGTGLDGRILENDVMAVIEGKKPKRIPSIQFGKRGKQPQPESPHHKINKPVSNQSQKPQQSSNIGSSGLNSQSSIVKMSLFEKGMQKSMTVACSIPHLYYHEEMDLTECDKLRKSLKQAGKKVTVMGVLIKTFSMALKKHPRMNSTYQPLKNEFQFTINHNHNISVAIASKNGLVVPNIKNVQTLSLSNIQSEIQRLKDLSQNARLTSNELNNGTVCLSNIGTIGGIMANPLILSPQTCIVAIGKKQVVAKYVNVKGKQGFEPKSVINVSFGCDHRIIDGASVANFCNQWKLLLQNPYVALSDMV